MVRPGFKYAAEAGAAAERGPIGIGPEAKPAAEVVVEAAAGAIDALGMARSIVDPDARARAEIAADAGRETAAGAAPALCPA